MPRNTIMTTVIEDENELEESENNFATWINSLVLVEDGKPISLDEDELPRDSSENFDEDRP